MTSISRVLWFRGVLNLVFRRLIGRELESSVGSVKPDLEMVLGNPKDYSDRWFIDSIDGSSIQSIVHRFNRWFIDQIDGSSIRSMVHKNGL